MRVVDTKHELCRFWSEGTADGKRICTSSGFHGSFFSRNVDKSRVLRLPEERGRLHSERITHRRPPDEKAGGERSGAQITQHPLDPSHSTVQVKIPSSLLSTVSFRETANYVLAVLSDPHA